MRLQKFSNSIRMCLQRFLVFLLICSLLTVNMSCTNKEEIEVDTLFKILHASETGLNFKNTLNPSDSLNILDYLYYYNGAGVAVGDVNNDGLPDVFLTANQGKNALFINKGNFTFEDVTSAAGLQGQADWNTGAIMADVNGDGFLDIYVCAVTGIHNFKGRNELYINNGDGTFVEKAEAFGLGFTNYTTSAAFFDYDNDGDLDMYLLNHAIHTQNSFGKASIRENRVDQSGDKLLRNDNNIFVDVSEEAGIYGGANGYGLGIATADFNNDGYTDIYVSNDFHEDDYYYVNNGDGTFSEKLKEDFSQTSRFSMGNDVSDINHDGYVDIFTLDMTPQQENVLKASMGDETYDMLRMRVDRLGYHYQFARNMLQINNDGQFFSETALLSGIAETDWSWSALFADYDQDGEQDVFISNGIPKRPNDLDYIKYISNKQIREKVNNSRFVDQKALDIMPSGKVPNYFYKGELDLSFKDVTKDWIGNSSVVANGSAYADLDNDGDLDIVTNTIDSEVVIYKNTIDTASNYLTLRFKYKDHNPFGLGTKVLSYHNGILQYKQLFTSKGFQSSSEPTIHFGYGKTETIDSLKIIWPDQTIQIAENIKTNQKLTIQVLHKRDKVDYTVLFPKKRKWFRGIDSLPGLRYEHKENNYIDFNRQKLIPYKVSDKGPAIVVSDFNNDGLDDLFFGSSKNFKSEVYLQAKNGFQKLDTPFLDDDKDHEDVVAIAEDFDQDGSKDLLIGSAGGEILYTKEKLQDRLYLNKNTNFNRASFPKINANTSVIATHDIDGDGDLDIFIGSYISADNFGKIPESFLLINDNNSFRTSDQKELKSLGMVTDAIWSDIDGDGNKELFVVGEWMSPKILKYTSGSFKDMTNKYLGNAPLGLWQMIKPFDVDSDGDTDYVLGNFGTNTKFKATGDHPLKMYYSDFDSNGTPETIIALYKEGQYYPILGLDELAAQMNFLKKKYTSYRDFAGKTLEEILGRDKLDEAKLFEVTELRSGYLRNDNGNYVFKSFENSMQIAPLTRALNYDFEGDGEQELLLAGNYTGLIPYHSKLDAFAGAIIKAGKIIEGKDIGLNLTQHVVRGLNILKFDSKEYIIVTMNNDKPQIYELVK